MPPKISLKTSIPPSQSLESAPVQTPGGTRLKLKFGQSQPSTPAVELPSAVSASSKKTKKRAANEELTSPAVKRVASNANGQRRSSLKLNFTAPKNVSNAGASAGSSAPKLKLQKRSSSGVGIVKAIRVRGKVPDRAPGNAYDSEDDERERDPATEQQLVLRMQPGEDCDFLRQAITDRTIGVPPQEGGAEVTIKFLDRDLRRAFITIRKNMYAAALVDLPCIVETMKSWDKRGWWKVADISQMLLVLGQVQNEEQAKTMPLPAGAVNEKTMAYAHGLTPPMHWVRKHRFRKRLSYKDHANVEDEVNRLVEDDARIEQEGGTTSYEIISRESLDRSPEPEYYDDEPMDTIENGGYDDASGAEGLDLDDFEAGFDDANFAQPDQIVTSAVLVDSPVTLGEHADRLPAPSETPAATPLGTESPAVVVEVEAGEAEESSDEDEDDDDDDAEIDAFDEDAQRKAMELNQQKQEIEDLESAIKTQQQTLNATKNQLLQKRQREKLLALQADLEIKRRAFGYADEDEEDDG